MTTLNRIDRRTLLRGAGRTALALPLLEAMLPRRANAAEPRKRFVVIYTPGGTVRDQWVPTGTEQNFTLSPILKPLNALKSKLTVLDGIDLKVTEQGYGHPHTRGMAALLTGMPTNQGNYETCGGKSGFASGVSIDQLIAAKISAGLKFRSLQLAVRWPSFFYGGASISPTNVLCYEGDNRPLPPATDPKNVWKTLFSDLSANADDV